MLRSGSGVTGLSGGVVAVLGQFWGSAGAFLPIVELRRFIFLPPGSILVYILIFSYLYDLI